MAISRKDSIVARNIIMDYYDNLTLKMNDDFQDENYHTFHNKSDTCVDNITIFLKIKDDVIEDAKFKGIGCAISLASTEILLQKIINQKIDDVKLILINYQDLLLGKENEQTEDIIDDLIIFHNVHKQPNRVNCAKVAATAISEIFKELNK